MYDKNEYIILKWTTRNKTYYQNLGYEFTNMGDELIVRAGDLPPDSNVHITATCDCEDCNNIQLTPLRNYNKIVGKSGMYKCKTCTFAKSMQDRDERNKQRIFKRFIELCEEHGCIPVTTIHDYPGIDGNVVFICPKHGTQKVRLNSIINAGAWCYACGKESMSDKCRLSQDVVKSIVESKNNNILLNPEDYINHDEKNLRVICGSCHREFQTSLSAIEAGNGRCAECGCRVAGESLKTTKEQFVEMATINGELVVDNPNDYTSMGDTLWFRCSCCGELFLSTPHNYIKRGFTRCDHCYTNYSSGEEQIKIFLESVGIKYERQKKYDDCRDQKPLPFDFYLPDRNTIIEYDGELHYMAVDYFGGIDTLLKTQTHDKIKNEYCAKNHITIIRIPYWNKQKISEILTEELDLNE